eukprot:5871288-Pleurochrysis_carterae.AAC.3
MWKIDGEVEHHDLRAVSSGDQSHASEAAGFSKLCIRYIICSEARNAEDDARLHRADGRSVQAKFSHGVHHDREFYTISHCSPSIIISANQGARSNLAGTCTSTCEENKTDMPVIALSTHQPICPSISGTRPGPNCNQSCQFCLVEVDGSCQPSACHASAKF